MEAKKKRPGMNIGLMALMGLVSILAFGTMGARASGITDLPAQVGTALGISADAAGILLSAAIMASAGITLATAKQPMIPTTIVLVAIMGALIAIGWLGIWLIIMAAIIIAAMFGKSMSEAIWARV